MTGKVYSKEFKEDVVKYAENYEGSIADVARKFEVPLGTIYAWIKAKEDHKEEAFIGSGHLRKKSAEEKAKDRELRELREENAILKKRWPSFKSKRRKI